MLAILALEGKDMGSWGLLPANRAYLVGSKKVRYSVSKTRWEAPKE